MPSDARVRLVEQSTQSSVSLKDIQELFNYYQNITEKTGEQLEWSYANNAFPYTINNIDNKYFILSSESEQYFKIYIGLEGEQTILFRLPSSATHGDKGKAVELSKFFAKKLQAELELFNGRKMYFYKRK